VKRGTETAIKLVKKEIIKHKKLGKYKEIRIDKKYELRILYEVPARVLVSATQLCNSKPVRRVVYSLFS